MERDTHKPYAQNLRLQRASPAVRVHSRSSRGFIEGAGGDLNTLTTQSADGVGVEDGEVGLTENALGYMSGYGKRRGWNYLTVA